MHNRDLIQEKTKKVLKVLDGCNMDEALTIMVNLAGHIVANKTGGVLKQVDQEARNIGLNVRVAAVEKLLHEDSKRQAQKRKEG